MIRESQRFFLWRRGQVRCERGGERIELPEFYFGRGLGNLGQSEAASYQQLWLVEVYYGDKGKRLHHDFQAGKSFYEEYHQPFYRRTDIGLSVAEVIRDYLNEPE